MQKVLYKHINSAALQASENRTWIQCFCGNDNGRLIKCYCQISPLRYAALGMTNLVLLECLILVSLHMRRSTPKLKLGG